MKKVLIGSLMVGACMLAGSASAQQVTAEKTGAPPNMPLLIGGASVFGATYIPSFIVGVASSNTADRWLLAPVIGPWVDLGERGCAGNDCTGDVGNKLLLIGDGILQAVGAGAFVASFFVPQARVSATAKRREPEKARIRFTPMSLGHGPSAAAGVVGTF